MRYISTRGQAPELTFEDAMLTGLARDGGLYVPAQWPQLSAEQIAGFASKPYADVAYTVMRPFVGDTFSDAEFRAIIERAYAPFAHRSVTPLSEVKPGTHLLELYHGPTLAFKDVAMQLIGQMFEAVLKRSSRRITIVGATSGDTGSAAIEAFKGLEGVDVFIMYPHGRVSEVQRRQMTTPTEANVRALAVHADFDARQARLKEMFANDSFRDAVNLTAVNSINWARVMAQVVYYFTAAVSLGAPQRKISFTVPTGNFGDIFAGYVAKRMGLPIDRLVIATNQNDILDRTLRTGAYEAGAVAPSISPSMDIQVSSNFERLLFDLYDRDGSATAQAMTEFTTTKTTTLPQGALDALKAEFTSHAVSEDETRATITEAANHALTNICPHTAVGLAAAQREPASPTPMVVLATAHPAKFPDAVEAATGTRPGLPPHMADLFERDERVTQIDNDRAAIEAHILKARA